MKRKIIYQVLLGIVGAVVLGVISGYNFTMYGANNGCFPFVDPLMSDAGYMSCGPFGLIVGAVAGAVIGVLLSRVDWQKFFKK